MADSGLTAGFLFAPTPHHGDLLGYGFDIRSLGDVVLGITSRTLTKKKSSAPLLMQCRDPIITVTSNLPFPVVGHATKIHK